MIKKVQQDLRAFFFTQDKYISHDKHLPFLKDPGDDIIIVMLYQHCHQQWTHVKGKKQSYNHLSNISFSPFYTVSEYNQRGTVKLFDCDLSSSRNQTLQLFSLSSKAIKGSLKAWSDLFSLWHLGDIIGTDRERPECLVSWRLWFVCGELNWRDPLGHHPTLWYILQYELWIDFIYNTQESEMLNGNGIFGV